VLLLALIWSFHAHYGQPAAFSLKVPTFAYLFVIIALRALRFDYRLVLATGLAAVFGWALLAALVLWTSAEGTVTRNFVAYIVGNRILIGAEIEKIVSLLIVTGLLAFVVARAQSTLTTAVRAEMAARDIGRFLSRGVAEVIKRADAPIEPGQAVPREAAVLMLDIRGFTRMSATAPPQEVVKLLTSFHERVVPIVWPHGGVVDKFLGDGVMATFGAVEPSQTAAADAVRALAAIMAEAEAWADGLPGALAGERLAVNGAVASGPVVFATLGNLERLEYTVIGDAVNLAAKLEKHNKTAGTRGLANGSTYAQALEQGYTPPRAFEIRLLQTVAGAPEPLDLVVVAA